MDAWSDWAATEFSAPVAHAISVDSVDETPPESGTAASKRPSVTNSKRGPGRPHGSSRISREYFQSQNLQGGGQAVGNAQRGRPRLSGGQSQGQGQDSQDFAAANLAIVSGCRDGSQSTPVACPAGIAASLLSRSGASLLQRKFLFLALRHHTRSTSTDCNQGDKVEDTDKAAVSSSGGDSGVHEDSDPTVMNVLDRSISSDGHVRTLSAQAADLGIARKTLTRHKHAIASCLVQATGISWACFLQRIAELIQNRVLKGVCLIRKRVYDETPFRMRVSVAAEEGATGKNETTHSLAKTLQTRYSLGLLLQHVASKSLFFVHGLMAVPLQILQRTKAENLFEAQKQVERLIPGIDEMSKHFTRTIQLATTDRYSANTVAEQALRGLNPSHLAFHLSCDVHRLSTCQTWQLGVVASHISALISASLIMREAGALTHMQQCIFKVIQDRLVVEYGQPPGGQMQEHRAAVINLFLGGDLSKKEDSLALKRARQRAILKYYLNGDWESETIHVYSSSHVNRAQLLQAMRKFVVPALLPSAISLFPRNRWHGGETAVDEAGLLFACHNIGPAAFKMFLEKKDKSDIAAGNVAVDEAGQYEHVSRLAVDPGSIAEVDMCLDHVNTQRQDPADAQDDGLQPAASSAVDWAEINRSMRRMVGSWLKSSPAPCLVIIRHTMGPAVNLMRKLLSQAGEAWEKRQQLKAARGEKRQYRISEAFRGNDVTSAFEDLARRFHEPILALPLTARDNSFKVLAFRLLARFAGALHLVLKVHRGGFPFKLFEMMLAGNPEGRKEVATKISTSPSCLFDQGTRDFLSEFDSVDKLCSDEGLAALQALAVMAEVDVVSIETRHAAARRLLMSRHQTWGFAFADVAAEHLCRQMRRNLFEGPQKQYRRKMNKSQLKRRRSKAQVAPSGKKHGRRQRENKPPEHRTGGAQRAFLHIKLQEATNEDWKDRSSLFARLGAEFRNLTPEQKKFYQELGEAGTISGRQGGPSFAPTSRADRCSSRLAAKAFSVVPANEHEHMAVCEIKKAERKAQNASRLAIAVERAEKLELAEYVQANQMDMHGATEPLRAFNEQHMTLQPGVLPVSMWSPPSLSLSKALDFGGMVCVCGTRQRPKA